MAWESRGCELYDGDMLIAVFRGPYAVACQNAEIAAWAHNEMQKQLIANSKPDDDEVE